MAKGRTVELYSTKESEIKSWIESIKTYTIMIDLKKEFVVGKLLGKGTSA